MNNEPCMFESQLMVAETYFFWSVSRKKTYYKIAGSSLHKELNEATKSESGLCSILRLYNLNHFYSKSAIRCEVKFQPVYFDHPCIKNEAPRSETVLRTIVCLYNLNQFYSKPWTVVQYVFSVYILSHHFSCFVPVLNSRLCCTVVEIARCGWNCPMWLKFPDVFVA